MDPVPSSRRKPMRPAFTILPNWPGFSVRTKLLTLVVRGMEVARPTRIALQAFRYYRSHRDPQRPRVLCVGYQKTGTTSFAHAMRELGFSHYGYDRDLYRALQAGDLERCLRFAERFDSLDDLPWSDPRFIRKFQERFPGSYYVLLERDDASWASSFQAYYGLHESKSALLQRLHRHNEEVLHLLADEPHLLRMNICAGEGYEKLCPFLGRTHPGVPFAWANKGSIPSPEPRKTTDG